MGNLKPSVCGLITEIKNIVTLGNIVGSAQSEILGRLETIGKMAQRMEDRLQRYRESIEDLGFVRNYDVRKMERILKERK